jgi:hypothetical protein
MLVFALVFVPSIVAKPIHAFHDRSVWQECPFRGHPTFIGLLFMPVPIWQPARREISVGIVTRLPAGQFGARCPAERKIILFFETSRPALGPTQPLTRSWGLFGLGEMAREWRWPLVSLCFQVKNVCVWSYTSNLPHMPPWRGHGQLSFLSFTHVTAVLTFDAGAIPAPFKKGSWMLCGRSDRCIIF